MYLLKQLVLPPGILLIAFFLSFLILIRKSLTGMLLLLVTLASFYFLSIPLGAYILSKPLYADYLTDEKIAALKNAPQHYAIVVLGDGRYANAKEYEGNDTVSSESLVRIRYGAYLYKKTHFPMLVSGGAIAKGDTSEASLMAHVLSDQFNVPVRFLESHSKNTHQNAAFSAVMLEKNNISHILLVSHAVHMKRAIAYFKQQNIDVIPAPTAFLSRKDADSIRAWIPSLAAFQASSNALYEWLGYLWLVILG